MSDDFKNHSAGLQSPASKLFAVVPDDRVDLPIASRALNVAEAGFVQVTTTGGTTEAVYIAAGSAFPVRAVRVWATGTDATGIVALS
jgi:hypothetical protein